MRKSSLVGIGRLCGAFVLLGLALGGYISFGSDTVALAGASAPAEPKVVWRYNPTAAEVKDDGTQAIALVPLSGGGTGVRITTRNDGWNSSLSVPPGILKGGQDYTAIATYEVVDPTRAPATFYLLARSKTLSTGMDIWRKWTGAKGERGTVHLPMTLRKANDWTLTLGIEGPGVLILSDLRIVEGAGRVLVPALAGAKPQPGSLPREMRLPTGGEPFQIKPPAPTAGAVTLSATDFGLHPSGDTPTSDEDAERNFAALTAAIAACKSRGAARLVVPKGIYRFASDDALRLDGMQDFTLDASGSEFIFTRLHPNRPAILIANSQRCVVQNLTVDWDWKVAPIAHLTNVVRIAPDGKSVDLAFPDDDAAEVARARTMPWLEFFPMEPATFRPVAGAKIWMPRQTRIEALGEKSVRILLDQPLPLKTGASYAIRHFDYQMNAFNLTSNHDLLLDQVTIYSMPGMGWVSSGEQDHWGLRRCRIVPRPGTRRPMTTAADGFHSYESQGFLSLEECEISHCGDDCVNIHDNCGSGVTRVDDHNLFAPDTTNWRARFRPGDRVELCGPNYAPLGFASELTAVKRDGKAATLTFSDTLPADLPSNTILWNHRYETRNVRIEKCKFHNSGGRGILLAAHGARIEGNIFDHLFAGAFQFHTEIMPGWNEGHGASNIVFRNNVIRTVNARETFGGAALYATAVLPAGPGTFPLFHDILVENNRLEDCYGPAMQFSACRNVVVRGNTITTVMPLPNATPLRSTILIDRASAMTLGANTWISSPHVSRAGVMLDPATTSGIQAHGNTLR